MKNLFRKPSILNLANVFLLRWVVFGFCCLYSDGFSQTTFGQSGTLLTPSTETQAVGSFSVGGYFRSIAVSDLRFDETPVFLTTGVNQDMEVGFSFPSVWNRPAPPPHFENHSLISFKYRFYGENRAKWRSAVCGVVQRSPMSSDTAFRNASVLGLGWINSFAIGKGYQFHTAVRHFFTNRSKPNNRDNLSLGVERSLSQKVQFIGDAYAVSNDLFSKPISVSLVSGIRYFYKPHIHLVMGGGMGINRGTADWQYLVGVSITAAPMKVGIAEPQLGGLLFPLDPTDIADQPLMEVVKGIPPPAGGEEAPPAVAKTVVSSPVRARLFFDRGSFTLNAFEKRMLSIHTTDLTKLPQTNPILISGYADPVGSRLDNRALSIARSLYVTSHIVQEGKLLPSRIVLGGVGEERLIDPRSNPAIDQLNRWVEIESNQRANAFAEKNGNANHQSKNGQPPFAIQYQPSLSLDYPQFAHLSEKLRNNVEKLGVLKPNEAILLEVQYPKDADYRYALLAASEQMVLLSQLTPYQADQLYFRIVSNGAIKNEAKEEAIQINHWSTLQDGDQTTLQIKLKKTNPKDTVQYTVHSLMVLGDRAYQTDGEPYQKDQPFNPNLGMKVKKQPETFAQFVFPKVEDEVYQAYYLLYLLDSQQKVVGQFSLVQPNLLKKWKQRFPAAVGLTLKEKVPSVPLQMQFRKVVLPNGTNERNRETKSNEVRKSPQ